MRVLILGGTRFLGRHLVQEALKSGHDVTLFHRGEGGCSLFPEVDHIHGDRDGNLDLLAGKTWDVAVDTCGYVPRLVRAATEALKDRVEHYTFVSSISVYPEFTRGMDESSPVADLEDPTLEDITPETYGALKALCEAAAEEVMPGSVLHVRSGLIVGPHDPTDRFTYWVRRVSMGGRVLVPEPASRPVQVIHAADLARWILDMGTRRTTGVFHVTGPEEPHTMEEFLAACKEAGGGNGEWVWAPEAFLDREKVAWWQDVPLCIDSDSRSVMEVGLEKVLETGITFRPLLQTIRETIIWDMERPAGTELKAGLKAIREVELLGILDEDEKARTTVP